MRSLLLFTPILGLLACTATWGRVVEYSPERADHPLVVEVYRAVLVRLKGEPSPDSFAIDQRRGSAPLAAPGQVPRHWVDTLKHEVRLALSDPSGSKLADSTDVAVAAQSLGIPLVASDTSEEWGECPPIGQSPKSS